MLMTLALLYQVAQHRDLFSRNKAPCQSMGGHPTLNRSVPPVVHTDTVVATEIYSQRMQKALPDASKMVGDCAGWLAGERASKHSGRDRST